MVEQMSGGGLSTGFILIVGVCVMVVTPLVWVAIMLTCGVHRRDSDTEGAPAGPNNADSQAASKELAMHIIAALQQNDIVQKERFNDAVRIAVDKIQLRKALEEG